MNVNQITYPNETERFLYLDSARGIAALSVLIGHFLDYRLSGNFYFNLECTIINSGDAVSFFFVLSGFVLSYKYLNSDKNLNVKEFYLRRILRIYPGYIFAVLTLFLSYNQHGILFSIFKELFYYNKQNLWNELLLVRGNHNFYPPGWSLEIEMAFSFLMPILILCAQKNIKAIISIIPICYFVGVPYISTWVVHFGLGMIAAYYYSSIKNFDFSKSKFYPFRWLIFILTYFLYSMRYFDKNLYFSENIYYRTFCLYTKFDFFQFSAYASFIILLWILNNTKTQKILSAKLLVFLGKISYGIYLMHFIVMIIILKNQDSLMPYLKNELTFISIMLPVSIFVTILLATAVYNFIEKPFIHWGKKFYN